jgi:hypothetical protein
MHGQSRQDVPGWTVWLLLLGVTGLGSLWVQNDSTEDERVPAFEGSHGYFDEPESPEPLAPPRIVFPSVDDETTTDPPRFQDGQ